MGDRDDKKKPSLGGGMSFNKAMPNFMAVMAGGSGAAPDLGGIEGAMQRHAQREREERPDREDNEDEAPLVVDEVDALTSKERQKLEGGGKKHSGGSLKFKDETSAAAKFSESAHDFVAEAEERRRAEQAEAEAEAEAAGGKIVFKSSAKAASSSSSSSSKRKLGAEAGELKKAPKAKAVKNAKLLSFDAEEDE